MYMQRHVTGWLSVKVSLIPDESYLWTAPMSGASDWSITLKYWTPSGLGASRVDALSSPESSHKIVSCFHFSFSFGENQISQPFWLTNGIFSYRLRSHSLGSTLPPAVMILLDKSLV